MYICEKSTNECFDYGKVPFARARIALHNVLETSAFFFSVFIFVFSIYDN